MAVRKILRKNVDSTSVESNEIKKAEFYYNAVAKFEESATKSYERNNAKINVFVTVLSTVIPILTGVGYLTLSNISTVSFFVFYVISLSVLVITLAKCVHLLAPKWFSCIEAGKIMKDNDKEKASFIIFRVAANWEDCIRDNILKINKLYSGLKLVCPFYYYWIDRFGFRFFFTGYRVFFGTICDYN